MWFVVCNYGNVRPETASRTPLHKTLPLQEKAAAARRFHRLPRPVWKGLYFCYFQAMDEINS